MLTAGEYKAKATGPGVLGESEQKGTPFVQVELEVIEGVHKGEKISWRGYLTEKTEERTCESLLLLGWTGADFGTRPGVGTKEVKIVLAEETYEGKTRVKVQWINDPGRVSVSVASPEVVSGFASRMQAIADGLKAKKPGASAPAPTPAYDPPF